MAMQGLRLRLGAQPQQVLHLVVALRKAGYREVQFYNGEGFKELMWRWAILYHHVFVQYVLGASIGLRGI
jgi:hypothetical protein